MIDVHTGGNVGYGPSISLHADSPQKSEGNVGTTALTFTLTLSAPASTGIDVSYVTMNGSASAGSDFEFRKGTVSLGPGDTSATVGVQVIGDQVDEDNETFQLKLTSNAGIEIATSLATGTIQDDDGPPAISTGDAAVVEGNAGVRKMLFPVTLSAPSAKPVTVDFATADALAETPVDYLPASGQLTFQPGTTALSLSVVTRGDTMDEGDEHLMLNLLNPTNAALLTASAVGTIVNDDPTSGLEQRPSNLSCIAPDKPTVSTSIDMTQMFGGAGTFAQPLALLLAPNDPSQWYVVEQGGAVYRYANDPAVTSRELFIDLTGRANPNFNESGLLGMAFHPDYATNRFVYLSYTATGPDETYELTSRLSRFQSLDDGLTLDPDSEVILLSHDQPDRNHNGGHVAFGPDGYLYFGLGDGGSSGDPGNRAQNTKNLFGAVMRIDVDAGPPYGIPSDNPFAGNPLCDISTTGIDSAQDCPEIYAWGLRNPWRWSFDEATGLLWLADVGQGAHEEVDLIELGGNYGWRIQEGFSCFNPSTNCDTTNLIQPIITYDHSVGQSITGGHVYRGTEIPELIGRYVFADYITGTIFASTSLGDGNYGHEQLADTSLFISHFAEDESGELYFLDYFGGSVLRIIQFGGTSIDTIPALLSATGCTDEFDVTLPAPGLIPYDTNVSFWSDGAAKERFLALPDGTTVDVDVNGAWQFPVGTVLKKNFRLLNALIETRLMMRHTNGEWAGYTYEWNEEQTEATRVIGGKIRDVNGQNWIYPSETQCMQCHNAAAGFSLGLEHAQFNLDFTYPDTGITANQLYTADFIDILTDPLPDTPHNLPSLAGLSGGGYVLDFNSLQTASYSNQDAHANVSVRNGGATLELADNTQRMTLQTFNITPDTVLVFDFQSSVEGEVHGIGFDENDVFNDDIRIFQLFGTQNWNGSNHDFEDYAGVGRKHYVIPVGHYYTGSAMNLVFMNDQDAGLGSNSRFSNVRVISCPDCLDFKVYSTSSYSNQDQQKNVSIEDDGATLVLNGNTWRRTNQAFEITEHTYITFEFESTFEGEIHSIGFDETDVWNDAVRMFRLHGAQSNSDFTDYETYTGPGREYFQIPVGKYYTGGAMRLIFGNDDDGGAGSNSRFSNVRVVTCPDCIDFADTPMSSYSNQDVSAMASVEVGGYRLALADNTWRRTDMIFDIAADTVLEFDFESTAEGEVQGIGFDENDISNDAVRIFKLHGTQVSADIGDFNNYSGSGRAHYRIPVGQYYTGSSMALVIANDDDNLAGSNSRFSNVRIHSEPLQPGQTPTLQDQVRSYLHVNCAICHRPGGPTTSNMDLRFHTTWPEMNVCDVIPTIDAIGIDGAKLIAPGDASRSIIVNRMSRRDVHGMPPLGSGMVDAAGVNLLTTWIDGLSACPQ